MLGNAVCYRRLGYYLGFSRAEIEQKLENVVERGKGHLGSYLGRKWKAQTKLEVERAIDTDKYVKPLFEFWGYRWDEYNLSKPCEDLPWLELMRAKKGPLPGDDDPVLQKV